MGIMESISDLLCPLAFVTWNKTYVTDKEYIEKYSPLVPHYSHQTPITGECVFGSLAIFLDVGMEYSWWRHQMEAFSALLAICAGNSPVTGEFPA